MAGGTCTDKPGIFDNVKKEWSYHRQCQFKNKLDNKLLSDTFYKRRKVEYKRTCTRNISLFQKNIFRILTGCYNTDLYIIHDTNVIKTNCCIFKTRSPSLYNVLEFFFVKNGKPIKCYLNTVQAFQRIDNFVRLLYINTDISSEENTLLKFFSNEKNCIKSELIKSNENDISTSSLEMADSGLETGSLSLNENTESENSGTDIEESHVSDYIPTNDGFIRLNCDADKLNDKNISTKENKCIDSKACGSSSLMARQFDQKYLSGNNGDDEDEEDEEEEEITTCDNVDDVSRYENEVLNDIFYESDGNDNEQSASFVQTRSFEFIEPENLSSLMPTNGATKKNITTVDLSKEFISENNYQDEKISTIPQTRSMIVENIQHELSHSNDNSLNKSSSNVNNYYFIDASSLNDETEIASITSTSQQPIYMESLNYIPSKSHNSNDQMNKIISRSSSSSSHQCGHDEIAEFQRELKLTETLEPLVEQRKVKRVDSITDDKKIEKELLVVEIKEADSGESNHPSPCIDNNKRLQQCENNSNIINENINDSRRSSLIRGNTFELEPGDKKLTNARQEHERRQGNLVFSNSIPQYSGHRVDGDSVSDRTSNYSSMSSYFPHESSSSNNSIDKLKYQRTNYHDFMSYDGNLNNFNDPKYPMIKSASDKLLVDCTEINDNTIGDCISLPMTFDDHSHFGSIKKTKCDETTPIVSGGACTNDYSQSVIDSPVIIRRKTESTPIVSGGSIIMTPSPPSTTTTATSSTQDKIKSINRLSSSMTTWVVDMSDCTKTNEKSNPTSPNMSKSLSTNESCSSSKQINHTKTPDKPNSLGFFINLNDIDKPSMSKTITTTTKKDQNFINKQSFFIDLSSGNNDDKKIKKYQNNISNDCGKLQHDKNEKKNIFSMFIDLNDTKGVKSNEREIKSLNSLHQGHCSITDDDIGKSDSSKELRSSTDKKSVFMFIESDSPVVRRRTLSTSRPAFKRHSWNMEKSHQQITTTNGNSNGNSNGNGNGHIRREHKRAHSVSIDPDIHMKLSAKKSDSSMSLNNIGKTNSLNIPETSQEIIQSELNNDQIYYEIRDTPPNSHIEIINDDLRGRVMNQEYKELVRSDCMYSSTDASCDAKILDDERSDISMWEKTPTESTDCHTRKSETFDISSGGGSGPSPESDNNDFDLIEYHSDIINQVDQLHTTKISETHKSLTEKIKKIECEFDDDKLKIMSKSDNTKDKKQQASCSGFVRLSDLDKTPTDDSIKATTTMATTTSTTTATNNISYRMSKSIPETSWIESKLAVNRTIIGPCQIRTLSSRKYSTIMSTSLPAKNNKSPTDEFTSSALSGDGGGVNEMPSESDLSSMQSSMAKSCASTEETETSSIIATKPYNRLGEDLLRMFIEEINPDVTIDVGGRRIRAHKCILSSRCQYFAAILSGSWIENAGNVITLKGYSYNSVHFALCHIYSGESNIPDTISIVELATLADMLCLEGLKEIIGYTLKVKYCHLFHKPCQICTVGVLECMPLAAAYGLDEVYRKSLRWITRHFVRIWPCKAFASLPKELMDKCYQQHIVHMSADNILQTIMDCDKLLATLPNVRWAEPVFRMVSNLLEIALKYLSDNFSSILGNDNFQALGKDLTWNISRLEDNILSCADKLLPDQACKSYSRISKMISSIPSDDSIIKPQWNFLFIELLKKIKIRVEKCLIKDAARAARTTTWLKMDLELRRKIQELACLVILPNETIKRPTRHSNFMKDIKTPPNRTSTSRSLDLRRVKMTITDQIDLKTTTTTTIKSNISQIKNIMTKPKTDPLERKMQTTKIGQTIEANIRPKSWPNKLEVKSRYLEPRTKSVPKENPSDKTIVQQRRKNLISSSDSSRTSSPAMKRAVAAAAVAVNANKKPITRLKMSIKKDVKALSTDSLTETSTNNKSKKKDTLSKSCGITRPESPSLKSKNSTIDIDISTDSLADIKKKPITTTTTRKNGKMDNSISADSLDQHKTPKTNIAIKKSPILNKTTTTTTTTTGGKSQILERAKKSLSSSPPINQKNPLSLTTKRPARSIESSTAASRNRAAATTTIYHGSPSLRRNLLDAAKTPDIPSKNSNGISSKINSRQSTPSTSTPTSIKKDIFNPPRSESPNKKSPKLNGTTTTSTTRPTRPINAGKKTLKGIEDKLKNKCLVAETLGSRSGTFLKDEPTVLKKSDMKSTQVTT